MKVSVVMPSFNQARFVESALRSVLSQGYKNVEILFVDGGSTDGTMDIVSKYEGMMSYCISEPDNGQSHALRKGFLRATGDVLTWLNTDDVLLPGAIEDIVYTISSGNAIDVVFGNTIWIDAQSRIIRCAKSGETLSSKLLPRLGVLTAGGPAAFFTREIYDRIGGVNADLHYLMDTELWWRFVIHGASMRRSKRYLWGLRLHSEAKVSGHLFAAPGDPKQQRVSNERAAERLHLSKLIADFVWPVPSVLKGVVRAIHRGTSPPYYQSLWQTQVWRKQELSAAVRSICPTVV